MPLKTKRWITLGFALALATSPLSGSSIAKLPLTEEAFVAQFGDRATFVAPGVYEINAGKGDTVRLAFGASGQAYDRARFEEELAAAQDRQATTPSPSLARRIASLEQILLGLVPTPSRAAVTGVLCSQTQIRYSYSLDGYLSGSTAYAKASVGLDLDFGPFPDRYPDREAYAYLVTNKGGWCQESIAAQAITSGAIGIASATTSQSCATRCRGWESYSHAQHDGCSNGFVSLTRTSGNMNCAYP